jgi:hypothetical protein
MNPYKHCFNLKIMDLHIDKKIGMLLIVALIVGGIVGGAVGFIAGGEEGHGHGEFNDVSDAYRNQNDGETIDNNDTNENSATSTFSATSTTSAGAHASGTTSGVPNTN